MGMPAPVLASTTCKPNARCPSELPCHDHIAVKYTRGTSKKSSENTPKAPTREPRLEHTTPCPPSIFVYVHVTDASELPKTAKAMMSSGMSRMTASMRYAATRIQNPAYACPGAGPGGGGAQYCGLP